MPGNDSLRRRTARLAVCFLASTVSAAPSIPGSDVELLGGVGFTSLMMNRSYDASYTPPRVGSTSQLFETPDPRSRARQIVSHQGDTGWGGALGLAVYPHPVLGVQLFLERAAADLRVADFTHTADLVWDSIAFPSSEPVVRMASFAGEAPVTKPRMGVKTISLNGAARWKVGSRLSGTVSLGASYFRVRAEDLGVGAIGGSLGGHAVFFPGRYQMSLDTETAGRMGFNLGAELTLSLGSKFALAADARYFHASATAARVSIRGFAEEPSIEVARDQIDRYLSLPPIELDPRHFRLLIGLKLRP